MRTHQNHSIVKMELRQQLIVLIETTVMAGSSITEILTTVEGVVVILGKMMLVSALTYEW
ncbi:MAG: hypothetical protein HC849_19530 [Oscillatoriales cyanobacterium RU_3_3]|nr:hypothetical protein [Oscillatoriales cyanobacterium RU_3_3]